MNEYPGANNQTTMEGNTKETYAKKISRNVPDTGKFKKIKKLLKNAK